MLSVSSGLQLIACWLVSLSTCPSKDPVSGEISPFSCDRFWIVTCPTLQLSAILVSRSVVWRAGATLSFSSCFERVNNEFCYSPTGFKWCGVCFHYISLCFCCVSYLQWVATTPWAASQSASHQYIPRMSNTLMVPPIQLCTLRLTDTCTNHCNYLSLPFLFFFTSLHYDFIEILLPIIFPSSQWTLHCTPIFHSLRFVWVFSFTRVFGALCP